MQRKTISRLLSLALVLVASSVGAVACTSGDKATVVYFDEQEGNNEPYRTRMIVTPSYVRFDDDDDKGDFVLYDRKRKTIYSTNSMDQRTLVIQWKDPGVVTPSTLKNRTEKMKEDVPAVGGHAVNHYQIYTNDELCYDMYAAEGLLPEAVKAMAEFQKTLSVEHAVFMKASPMPNAGGCDAMNNVYEPARYLQFGFPVHARDYLGRSRQLANYKIGQSVSSDLFVLPASYQQFTTEEIRGGAIPPVQ